MKIGNDAFAFFVKKPRSKFVDMYHTLPHLHQIKKLLVIHCILVTKSYVFTLLSV